MFGNFECEANIGRLLTALNVGQLDQVEMSSGTTSSALLF